MLSKHVGKIAAADNPYHEISATIVDRIEEWLAVRGITQRELARRCGHTNWHTVNNWWCMLRIRVAAGQSTFTAKTLGRLSRATGMRIYELLEPFK